MISLWNMNLFDRIIVVTTSFVSRIITALHLGAGATWPGEIALTFSPSILTSLSKNLNIILVVGTNGKTTTSLMISQMLKEQGFTVVHNNSGANLLNGVISALIQQLHADWGVFEVDENSLPLVLKYVTPKAIVVLNLFRDQLDRYGEVDVIVEKWRKALASLDSGNQRIKSYQLILNADDPGVAWLGKDHKNVSYFGLNDKTKFIKTKEHATDSTFCPKCGNRLIYDGAYYSHIGLWRCIKCGNKRPEPTVSKWPTVLPGLYNQYNTLAAVATLQTLGITPLLTSFVPAFGRQEEFTVKGKKIKVFLSKNPTGFNASLRTAIEMGAENFLFVLNDRIPDGRDVSWIWDVDFEMLPKTAAITVSGDRVHDLSLRMKYADLKMVIEPDLQKAVAGKDLYILATYSAMLEVRKILTGRKIL